MGGINIKLMQGIDDTENQLQKEKLPQKAEEKEDIKDTKETVRNPQKPGKQPRKKRTHQ